MSPTRHALTWDQMTWHLDDYCCSAEMALRKIAEKVVKNHDDSVGLMVANHSEGSESSVVITTLLTSEMTTTTKLLHCWLRGTVVECRSLAGELSRSCARPVADG